MSQPAGNALSLKIKFKSETYDAFVERYGGDLSPGGIFIRSRNPLAIGAKINFDLSLSNGEPLLTGSGTVVWVRQPDPRQPSTSPGMGVRFDQITDESRVRLNRILAEKTKRERAGQPVGRGPTPIPEGPVASSEDDLRTTAPVAMNVPPAARPTGKSESAQNRAPTPARGVQTVAGRAPAGFNMAAVRDGFSEATRAVPPPGWGAPPSSQERIPARASMPAAPPPSGPPGSFNKSESTRSGGPSQELLNRATPVAPMPVFARNPIPTAPAKKGGFEAASTVAAPRGAVAGQATDVAAGMIGTQAASGRSAASEWDSEHTEIMENIPSFDFAEEEDEGDPEEGTPTTVRGQALPAQGTSRPTPSPAKPAGLDMLAHLMPAVESSMQPEEKTPPFEEPHTVGLGPNRRPTGELNNLFDGEEMPVSVEQSMPYDTGVTASSSELEQASRGLASASRVAMKVGPAKPPAKSRKPLLIALVAVAVLGGAGYVYVEFMVDPTVGEDINRPPTSGSSFAPPPVTQPPGATPPAPEPTPVPEPTPAPEPTLVPEPTPAPQPTAVPEPIPAPQPKPVSPAAAAPTPAPRSPAPATRPPVAPSGGRKTAAGNPVSADAEVIHWLRVRSVPSAAEVYIDGVKEGTTPFERRMFDIARPYALSVRKDGFESHEQMLSSSDPWIRRGKEFSLTIATRLKLTAGTAPANPAPANP